MNMNIHNDPEDIEYLDAIELRKRPVTDEQYRKFEGYAAEIFSAFGMDLNLPARFSIGALLGRRSVNLEGWGYPVCQ
jgi:hypothetical protein